MCYYSSMRISSFNKPNYMYGKWYHRVDNFIYNTGKRCYHVCKRVNDHFAHHRHKYMTGLYFAMVGASTYYLLHILHRSIVRARVNKQIALDKARAKIAYDNYVKKHNLNTIA